MALVGNSQVVNIASVWYLSVTNSRVVNHNVMLLQQFICQISSEFFIFQQDSASLCQIWSKSVKMRWRYDDFSIYPTWRPFAIFNLWCVFSDHPRRAFGGLYHCAKFGRNRL